jgi:hypothetical protein
MATPDTWNLSDATDRIVKPPTLDVNRAFAEGDHLHVGSAKSIAGLNLGSLAGWMAPLPHPSDPDYRNHYDGIVRSFVSSNKVAEVLNRHKAGVVGRQPSRGFESKAPIPEDREMTPELMRLKEQADAWNAERWETEGMHTSMQDAVVSLLYSGRQPVRLVLPPGLLEPGANEGEVRIPKVPLPEMLKILRLTYPRPEECCIYVDPDFFEEIGIFSYARDGVRHAEVTWVDRSTGFTHIRQINDNGPLAERVYDFGGLIPIFEMRRAVLITPPIIQNNMALNLALSTVARNVWALSARERYGFNIDPPGRKTVGADGQETIERDPVPVGQGVFNFFNGNPLYSQEDGKTIVGYETPSMQVEDPAEIGPAKEAIALHAWEILSESRQLHAVMGADATASAISRIVARVEFMGSLNETKPTVDACLEWQMNTRVAMAEAFSEGREGQRAPHRFTALLRANAECKLDPGPITPEEKTALLALVDAGVYTKKTALQLMGTEDASEELERVAIENRTKNILALIREADDLSLDREQALIILGGMKPEEAKALARGDLVNGITQ